MYYWEIVLIYVVDDSDEVREMLGDFLEASQLESMLFHSAAEFLAHEISTAPDDCLVLDNHMPGLSGLDLQAELHKRDVDIAIVFISGSSLSADVVKAIKGGAYQFLQKPFTQADLLNSISGAISERKALKRPTAEEKEKLAKLATLTPRESQLLDLLCLGYSNKSIANQLEVSISTVEFHRANLYKKLSANSLTDLILLHRSLPPY